MAFIPVVAAAPLLFLGFDAINKFEFNKKQQAFDTFSAFDFHESHAQQNFIDSFYSDQRRHVFKNDDDKLSKKEEKASTKEKVEDELSEDEEWNGYVEETDQYFKK